MSLLEKAIRDGVEKEKCAISVLKTTRKMKHDLLILKTENSGGIIPCEWVVLVADESSNWFFGTAYSFNDEDSSLHVMIPDNQDPSFEGDIPLDHM